MASRADILIRILGESTGLRSELNKSSGEVQKFSRDVEKSSQRLSAFGNIVQGIFQGIGQATFSAIASGVRGAVGEIGKAVKAASDLDESVNKVNVAFADSAQEILEWSKDSAAAFGQSRGQALEAASSFGLLFRTMGLTSDASADMSTQLVELASDLASINNIRPEEALEKLRAGLVGETEPLRTVGVLLNANVVEQKALALGLADTSAQLTEQDKVLARYQLILDQTSLAQGDFSRTSDGLANAQRILAAQIEDTSASFGQVLLPIQLAFTRGLSELIRIVEPYGLNIMDSLASGLAKGIVAILPVLQQVRALFAYWLKPGSPPRLLRELTEWGQSAMGEYLRGWTLADFGALEAMGGTFESIIRSFAGTGDIKETDLVSRVFGTQKALTQAIKEFRQLGSVSVETFANIATAAGPAGDKVTRLVQTYFDLQNSSRRAAEAQAELSDVTRRYDAILNPLQGKLKGLQDRQQELRDQKRLGELRLTLSDITASAYDKEQAALEIQQIQIQDEIDAREAERDTAVDAAKQKVDAAKAQETAAQQTFNMAQAVLDQQIKANALIAEETALRQRLIDEGIAEQKRVLAELEEIRNKEARDREIEQRKIEQAERERVAGLERIADAELRYRLASTDTAGQLAIMQQELSKTTVGSAEYFNILTQIVGLQERLAKESEKTSGGGLSTIIDQAIGDPAVLEEASAGIAELSAALEQAFAALSGADGQTVELNPAWQNFADTIGTIGQVVQETQPIIQGFIDLVMGRDVEGLDTTTDPFSDNFWLSGLVPFLRGLVLTLEGILDGDWAGLWQRFKDWVDTVLNLGSDDTDGTTVFFYTWLRDTVIPLFETLAATDWANVWTSFQTTVTNVWDAIVEYVQGRIAVLKSAIQEVTDLFNKLPGIGTNAPFDGQPGGGGGGGGGGGFFGSSFGSNPSIFSQSPVLAGAAGLGSMTTSTTNGPINISVNVTGADGVGVADQARNGVMDALRRSGLA